MTDPVRIGVVGSGLIARRSHLPAYTAAPGDARVVAIAGQDPAATTQLAQKYGIPATYDTWEALVADPAVEAVDVCAPNALHAPVAIAAARAGKHVLVEKPMTVSLADADAMIDAAGQAGVLLAVAHNLRFAPIFETIHDLATTGAVGELYTIRGVFGHAGPDESWGATSDWFWRQEMAGGGSLLDMGIHMIDLVRWFAGRPALQVTAMLSRRDKPTFADDNAMLIIRFEGDLLASVQCSWSARPHGDRQVVIHGREGNIAMGLAGEHPLTVNVRTPDGPRTTAPQIPAESPLGDPYRHFARCIRGLEEPRVPGIEGRRSLAVALAAYESARNDTVADVRV